MVRARHNDFDVKAQLGKGGGMGVSNVNLPSGWGGVSGLSIRFTQLVEPGLLNHQKETWHRVVRT